MRIEAFSVNNVLHKEGLVVVSCPSGGCGVDGCNCSKGHWISFIQATDDNGITEGVKISFESREELEDYLLRLQSRPRI